jgi:uncharacterized membrane protein YcaP (DUF421 family)
VIQHRQGFYSINEVERCTLEAGGGLAIKRKEPSAEELR